MRRTAARRYALIFCLLTLVPLLAAAQAQNPQNPPAVPSQPAPAASAMPSCPELARALTTVVRNDTRLRDWPDLTRYRASNRELGPPKASESRVVFMGDSITDLWQQPRFGGFFPGKPYVDRGISGQTTPQMLVRFRPDVIALQPKVVVVLAGTNDIAGNTGPQTDEEIEGNLTSMNDLARANGIRVVFASLLPVSAYHHADTDLSPPQTTLRPMTRIRAINEWMRAYAASHGAVYLDYFSSMVDSAGLLRAELSNDDLHPNEKGYAIMAPLAEAAIAQALK